MKAVVKSLAGKDVGEAVLNDAVFGLEPRKDLLHRCVLWQRARRQAGTHKTQTRSEVTTTGKKMYRQKGSGGARHGAKTATLFRGGQKAHGPVVRSHAHKLQKKVRALALRHALSAKAASGELVIVKDLKLKDAKTSLAEKSLGNIGVSNALIIDDKEAMQGFAKAARNIDHVDTLPVEGVNVYDILRRHHLVLSEKALEALHNRFDKDGATSAAATQPTKSAPKKAVDEKAEKAAADTKSTAKKPAAAKTAPKKPAAKKATAKASTTAQPATKTAPKKPAAKKPAVKKKDSGAE